MFICISIFSPVRSSSAFALHPFRDMGIPTSSFVDNELRVHHHSPEVSVFMEHQV